MYTVIYANMDPPKHTRSANIWQSEVVIGVEHPNCPPPFDGAVLR